ncbi:MAG: hypothetical protein ACYC97_05675, partial [Metallibacterium sp.]
NYFDLIEFKTKLKSFIDINPVLNSKKLLAELQHFEEFKDYTNNFKTDNFAIGDVSFQKGVQIKNILTKINERLAKVGNREQLLLKHGFDTKFSMHCVRLLSEGIELLETSNLEFPLRERDLLLQIRNGEFEVEKVIEIIESYENKTRILKDNNNLPKSPHFHEIEDLCIGMLKNYISECQ